MLGPGIGGLEVIVIALVALIVVGPKDLPLLMRRVGQFLGRARKMAAEFRASFDDMARQSELDDLRKEVEALRTGQMASLGKDADATFKDIDSALKQPVLDKPVQAKPELDKPTAEAAKGVDAIDPALDAVTHTPPMTEPAMPVATPEPEVASKPGRPKATKPSRPRKKATT